jgi:hypothetical protein
MFERYNITNERDQQDAMTALEQYRERERKLGGADDPLNDPSAEMTTRNANRKETARLQ